MKPLMLGCNLIAAYAALQQPTADPRTSEQDRFRRESPAKETLPGLLVWGGSILKYALYALFSAEATLLIFTCGPCPAFVFLLPANLAQRLTAVGMRLHPTSYFTLGHLLMCAGAAVRARCYRRLGARFTFRLALLDDHKLETHGPYAVVRHPAYGGALAFIVGTYMCVRDRASLLGALGVWSTPWGSALRFSGVVLAVLAAFAFVDRARVEDEVLRRKFGQQWVDWARKTPYKLIPFIL
ncbi:uncharacterized protein PHACADRAFT_151015, partial [Phanerochaete carnosa HHB-10118-sp]